MLYLYYLVYESQPQQYKHILVHMSLQFYWLNRTLPKGTQYNWHNSLRRYDQPQDKILLYMKNHKDKYLFHSTYTLYT